MRATKLVAKVRFSDRAFSATFDETTGQLRIRQGSKAIHSLHPPDSWLAVAVAARSTASGWGTRPSVEDLEAVLKEYLSDRFHIEAP